MEKSRVRLLSSKARMNPRIEINRAVVLRYQGMVRIWMLVGGILYEMRNPAMMLPSARRLMGLVKLGLFSFITIRGG